MKIVAMLVGAVLVGAVVWLSVVADLLALWHGAGLYALVALAFPAFIASGVYLTDHPPAWWLRRYWIREERRIVERAARWGD